VQVGVDRTQPTSVLFSRDGDRPKMTYIYIPIHIIRGYKIRASSTRGVVYLVERTYKRSLTRPEKNCGWFYKCRPDTNYIASYLLICRKLLFRLQKCAHVVQNKLFLHPNLYDDVPIVMTDLTFLNDFSWTRSLKRFYFCNYGDFNCWCAIRFIL